MEKLKLLIKAAQAHDLEAYGQLVRRFQDMAYGFTYSILGDFHLAEDAAQEAFVEAFRQLSQLDNPDAFGGWFRRIVFKYCDRITRRKDISTTTLDTAAEMKADEAGPAMIAEKREMKEKVLEAIHSLAQHQRTATTLFYINGYSHKEIAQFLEVPTTTVKKRLHDSRKQLKERMIDMVEDELQKHSLPESFTQRVVTLAEIIKTGGGKYFNFQFANGVSVKTRVDKEIQDERHLHLLVCGPTNIQCHGSDSLRVDSFILVPSSLVTVTQDDKNLNVGSLDKGQPASFEVVRQNKTQYTEKIEYTPSPIATGLLDIAPDGCFGFVRIGKDQRPYKYHGREQDTNEYSWHASPDDIYVPEEQIHNYKLKQDHTIECTWRQAAGNERFRSAVHILTVNGAKAKG